MTTTVADLGELGTTDGLRRPIDLTLERDGATWDLTGYTDPTLEAWDVRTRTTITPNGTLTVTDAAGGVVRYQPGAADPLHANSGRFEGRILVTPAGGAPAEPSALFRFTIAAAPQDPTP